MFISDALKSVTASATHLMCTSMSISKYHWMTCSLVFAVT